ncbi:MAG: putative Methylase [Candidatus Xenolissoclinum pacificiensis L6]|uniref:Methylase n=1 Tax=Candidatus Xenolissoclinum pacificiensis L6 TaxID=1401685 RepID=W2UZK5_9RICK|nr:MAG: putative Methylase [Candidatus Xenolissoclinum pacificiensis L6]
MQNKIYNLVASKGIRPVMSKVRESVFSILESRNLVSGMKVLDLFCGIGTMGVESVNKGAQSVLFIDIDIEVVKQRIASLPSELKNRMLCMCADIIDLKVSRIKYDLIFVDPPYDRNVFTSILLILQENHYLNEGAIVVCFMRYNTMFSRLVKGYSLYDVRLYGMTKVVFVKYCEYKNESDDRRIDCYIE